MIIKHILIAALTLIPFYLNAAELLVDLSCEIPAPQKSIHNASIVVRLYEYDSRLADSRAKEVDRVTVHGIDLPNSRTSTVQLPLNAKRTEKRSYYITVFIHPTDQLKERLYYINGFQKVFETTDSERLNITLTQKSK